MLNSWLPAQRTFKVVFAETYSLDSKTTIRAGAGRSFSKVTVVSGSNHYQGFIGLYAFSSPNQGIAPAFNWDTGLPPYPLPQAAAAPALSPAAASYPAAAPYYAPRQPEPPPATTQPQPDPELSSVPRPPMPVQ